MFSRTTEGTVDAERLGRARAAAPAPPRRIIEQARWQKRAGKSTQLALAPTERNATQRNATQRNASPPLLPFASGDLPGIEPATAAPIVYRAIH